ncbi:helix-turn-helix transcriptional regulator [Corynebacterium vitaeruminis]|uniref:helix-turn-helix transcriptional regulator n=1 Tax=Corynebacterium vitaeruminis TaxID=38305 RepID=UPI0023EF72D1|nr:helix-turn-helix transcriptional regulator [Corynebacterium vitaeruminis]
MDSIGDTARTRRKELLLTQSDLAELAMVSERFVRELESGKPTVRLDKVSAVLAVLGLELAVVQHVPEALR